jgi:putative transposase
VTQRGNRRQWTFFGAGDFGAYLALMAEWCAKQQVEILAYCLMPNHVHLVAVPRRPGGLARAIGEAHRRYTRRINFRKGWRGYLWQGRFASCVMDREHCVAAARYIERNPVRAGLARRAWEWPWSSAAAHVKGKGDVLVKPGGPLVAEVSDWRRFLASEDNAEEARDLRMHLRTGRPLGDEAFVTGLEKALGRSLRRRKPGPPAGRKRKSR